MSRRISQMLVLRILPFLALLSIPSALSGQWIGDSTSEAHIRNGINCVYNLTFDSARSEFRKVATDHPDHPAGHFFLAMVDWWHIVTHIEDKSHDNQFISDLDKVIDLCDKRLDRDENDLAALFFKGGALGFQGRLYGNREDWLKAANAGRQALPIVQQTYRLAPENDDILFGMGIYNYYADVIPDRYPFVKPFMFFFPKGDKLKGIEQLRHASQNAIYARVEATYFLLQLLFNYEKQYPEALQLAADLHSRFPNNAIFHKYVGRANAALGNWEKAHVIFEEVIRLAKMHQTGYDTLAEREAEYYLGTSEMNRQQYEESLRHFYRCDELSRTLDKEEFTGFMVIANLKIGMIYDLQLKRDLAIVQYQKVKEMKNYLNAHDQADMYLKKPYQKSLTPH